MMSYKAPFQVGGVVTPPYFVGREKELQEITNGLKTLSQNYVIIAPRRVGKTSLLWAMKTKLDKEKEGLAVYFNCREITTKDGFARKIIEAILREYEKKHAIKGYIENFKNSVRGKILEAIRKIDKIGGSIGKICETYIIFREGDINEEELLERAIDFLDIFSKEKNIKIIILFDEFQKLYDINGFLFDLLKSKIDTQKKVKYCVSGSSVSMLDEIFLKKDSPLYMMFTKIYLESLDRKTVKKYIQGRLKRFDVRITEEALEMIYNYTGGIPYYVQKIGHFCFDLSQLSEKNIDTTIVSKSFDRMLKEFDGEFESRFTEKFSPRKQAILREIARKDGARVSEIAKSIGVDVNYLGESMRFLVEAMVIIRKKRGFYELYDPIFKQWLKNEL
jgi:AAA+ ATPase superfamily predicted ATPase